MPPPPPAAGGLPAIGGGIGSAFALDLVRLGGLTRCVAPLKGGGERGQSLKSAQVLGCCLGAESQALVKSQARSGNGIESSRERMK